MNLVFDFNILITDFKDAYVGHEAVSKRGILTIKPAQKLASVEMGGKYIAPARRMRKSVEDMSETIEPVRHMKASFKGKMTKRQQRELEAEQDEGEGSKYYLYHRNKLKANVKRFNQI